MLLHYILYIVFQVYILLDRRDSVHLSWRKCMHVPTVMPAHFRNRLHKLKLKAIPGCK